jgi:hypothetical protein
MLEEDCKAFLDFVQKRDPVIVTSWTSKLKELHEVACPWQQGGWYCLWNQALLISLERKLVPESDRGSYYRIDSALPVIEFSYPQGTTEPWNGRPALLQGRIWSGFEQENQGFEAWYNSLTRWIRKNFIKNPVPLLHGYLGPAAHDWYKGGGILLPALRPPVTPQWLSWVEAQDQHRAVFSKLRFKRE